jgi:hypothetical protein
MPTEVARIPILDEASSEECVLQVLLLRRYWQSRYAKAPFFTLGLASYLDCHLGACAYRDRTLRHSNNELLMTHFGPLLTLMAEALGDHVGHPAHLAVEDAAVPGFHIYMPDQAFALPVASVHQDYQYRSVFPEITPEQTISFTLAISAPQGSGLNIWAEKDDPPLLHAYKAGEMIVHDGHCTHQAVLGFDGETERITLQGHGIQHDGRLVLYW